MNPTDPTSQMPTSPAPMPEPQPQPVFNSMPEPVMQQPVQTPRPSQSSPRSIIGIVGLAISSISLVVLPIIMVNMSGTYLTLLITLISGAIGAGISIFALKQSENASLIALAGFIVGIVAFSLSLVYVIQYGVTYEKYKTASTSTNTSY